MLGTLIKKEILEHLMSLRFAIACLLCLVVILCSVFVRGQDYVQVLDDWHQESEMARQRFRNDREPWGYGWGGAPAMVSRTPNPLGIFVRGVSDQNGGLVAVSWRERLQPAYRNLANPAAPLFPAIDLVLFVGVILSLMALVFGYDAICGEKQRGTLRLMLSYSVPRSTVLIAKWLGGFLPLALPFVLTAVAAAALVSIQKDVSLTAGQWARLGATVGLALLYVAVMYSLAVFVSCLTRGAATSIMILLSLWVLLVLVVPNVSPYVARAIQPEGSALEAEKQRQEASSRLERAAREDVDKYRENVLKLPERWWEAINWESWESKEKACLLWIYETPKWRDARLGALREWDKIDQQLRQKLDSQIRLSRGIARVSPFACFALAATELTDAGLMEQGRFYEQLRDYQLVYSKWGWDECEAMEITGYKTRDYPDWRTVRKPKPEFTYAPPAATDYLSAVGWDLGILAGSAFVLFMLSFVTFRHYDVR